MKDTEFTLDELLDIVAMPNKELACKLLLPHLKACCLENNAWDVIFEWGPFYVAWLLNGCFEQRIGDNTISWYALDKMCALPSEYAFDLIQKYYRLLDHRDLSRDFNLLPEKYAAELWLLELENRDYTVVGKKVISALMFYGADVATAVLLYYDEYLRYKREKLIINADAAMIIIEQFPKENRELLLPVMKNVNVCYWRTLPEMKKWCELPLDYAFLFWCAYFKFMLEKCRSNTVDYYDLEILLEMGVDNATLLLLEVFKVLPDYKFDQGAIEKIKSSLPSYYVTLLLEKQ